MIPVYGETLWVWPWSGLGQRDVRGAVLQCLPLLLGVAAWLVLALERRRLRGAILLGLCALAMWAPLETVLRQSTDLGRTLELLAGSWGIVLLAVLGCVLVAAGNRQQKRALGRGVGAWLTGLGGLALIAAFLYPVGSMGEVSGGGHLPIAIFVQAEVWNELWFLLLWLLGLFGHGLLGAASLFAVRVSDRFAEWIQNGISRLARLLPLSFSLILLGAYVLNASAGFGYFLLFFLKVASYVYAIVILAAIGLARWQDDAQPDAVWEVDEPGSGVPESEPAAVD